MRTVCEVLSPCRGLRPHHVQRDASEMREKPHVRILCGGRSVMGVPTAKIELGYTVCYAPGAVGLPLVRRSGPIQKERRQLDQPGSSFNHFAAGSRSASR